MNLERTNRATAAAISFIFIGAIFAVLSTGLKMRQTVPKLDARRGADRVKALTEMRVSDETVLNTPAIIDADHGTVRLPIETAMQKAVQDWQKPANARAGLSARAEAAARELPKAPPKPSAFE